MAYKVVFLILLFLTLLGIIEIAKIGNLALADYLAATMELIGLASLFIYAFNIKKVNKDFWKVYFYIYTFFWTTSLLDITILQGYLSKNVIIFKSSVQFDPIVSLFSLMITGLYIYTSYKISSKETKKDRV